MKLPVVDEVRKEDLTGAPPWLDAVLSVLNRFIRSTYQAIMGNLTFQDNIASQIYETDISQNDIDNDFRIAVTIRSKPMGVVLLQIYLKDEGSHTAMSGAGPVDWLFEDGKVRIYNIPGIDSTSRYIIRLLII